jgi:hypothetical protein
MSNRKRDRHVSDVADLTDKEAAAEREADEAAHNAREIERMNEADRARLEERRRENEKRPRR